MIVLTADCDLLQDFKARFAGDKPQDQCPPESFESHPASLLDVLLCDVYEEAQIRGRIQGSDIWRRVKQNQDERYHCFASADVGDPTRRRLPDLYLDFKKALTLPTDSLYEGLRNKGVERVAVVPPIYLHDLMHRFYGFLSRVGVPD